MKILPIAISAAFKQADYLVGKKTLEDQGHEFLCDAVIGSATQSYLNGTDAERLQELEQVLSHPEADVIWAVRGGYGITRLLPKIQPNLPFSKGGIITGMSDVTALTSHVLAQYKRKSLHAPLIKPLSKEPPEVLEALNLIFKGQARQVAYPRFSSPFETGETRGILIPMNLSILVELLATPSMPNLNEGILILEDTHEQPYRLDRMLTHLWAAGVLTGVQAIIVGHLTECGDNPLDAFLERCTECKIPCFTGFPIGHESPNWPVPIGVQAKIEVSGGRACLKILEELF